jgi:hypothetical protein
MLFLGDLGVLLRNHLLTWDRSRRMLLLGMLRVCGRAGRGRWSVYRLDAGCGLRTSVVCRVGLVMGG